MDKEQLSEERYKKTRRKLKIIGIILICTVVLFPVGIFFLIMASQRDIIAYQMQSIRPVATEGANKIIPEMGPGIQSGAQSFATGFSKGLSKDVEAELLKAKSLFDKQLITESEYQQMRKKILGM